MMVYLVNYEVRFLQNKDEQVEGYVKVEFISTYAKVFDTKFT
jgi:hypothetical protein